jgi:hypothetical protein
MHHIYNLRLLWHVTLQCIRKVAVHLGYSTAVYCDRLRTLNELKTAITVSIRNISQADLQKVFVNKINRVQACTDARGHHFQHLLQVHNDFPNALCMRRLV